MSTGNLVSDDREEPLSILTKDAVECSPKNVRVLVTKPEVSHTCKLGAIGGISLPFIV
jgi:hypothetical protein